ncbi:S1 RNA binding domain protein [Varibaculum cambriense]|uniref:Ribonuclease E n=2 Tax=Varibaculum cambriense TaxID=184870 RepID=A0AB34WYW9_9ACTO|nr:S1 RNA binding domain protein [Varibaculum cambriense]
MVKNPNNNETEFNQNSGAALFSGPTFSAPKRIESSPAAPAQLPAAPAFGAPMFAAAPIIEPSAPEGADVEKDAKPKRQGKKKTDSQGEKNGQSNNGKTDKKTRGAKKSRKNETSEGDNPSSEKGKDNHADKAQSQPEGNDSNHSNGTPNGSDEEDNGSSRRRRRRRSRGTVEASDQIEQVKGSTRLEAKKQRRREGRKEGRRPKVITESEYLARREAVDRTMLIRSKDGLNQIAVLEDNVLVEHYVSRHTQTTMVGSVYRGKVQNVLPSMEAAFVDLGRGRNAVLYAGEVNWDVAGMKGRPRRIEEALKSGDSITVQVTKDPIGHKGARLTSQVTLPGRFLVLVPGGSMTGISRKLPEGERRRLKKLLKVIVPKDFGVIIRTAAEGASEEQLRQDVERLQKQWEKIEKNAASSKSAPYLLHGEPELALRVVRDVFNEDFQKLIVQGKETFGQVDSYVKEFAPDLRERVEQWVGTDDIFAAHRVDEQLAKGMDRKVWLPSGGYLIIDRTEAMTVIDVNTGKYTGSGGTLEETVTRNNLESAEEIVRQLRLRDIGGIVVIDFVDMVLESNRDLVLRRLVECLGRDRTRHQVTEVTSLGLVQMTRKRVGEGLVEAFSTPCEHCEGRGFIVHTDPVENGANSDENLLSQGNKRESKDGKRSKTESKNRASMAKVAAAASKAHQEQPDLARPENEEQATSPAEKHDSRERGRNRAKRGSNHEDAAKAPKKDVKKDAVAEEEPAAETFPKTARTEKLAKKAEQSTSGQARAAATSGTVTPASEGAVMTIQNTGTAKSVSLEQLGASSPTWEKKIESDEGQGEQGPRRHAAVTA